MSGQRKSPIRSAEERNALVTKNLRLAGWAVKSFFRRNPQLGCHYGRDEAYSDACAGLVRAAELFEPELGYAFSTYANKWMLQSLQRGCSLAGRVIRCPEKVTKGCPAVRSLSVGFRGESLVASHEPRPSEVAYAEERREAVRRCLGKMDARDAEVIVRRAAGETLEQIGKTLGVGKERVRQIERRAREKLRYWVRRLAPGLVREVSA